MQRAIFLLLAACSATHDPHHGPDGGGPGSDACVPRACSEITAGCDLVTDDGCGHALTCGACDLPSTCGGDGVDHVCAIPADDRVCRGGWCWEAQAPIPMAIAGMAAISATDVWAVGARGAVEHYDGTTWTFVDVGTSADLHAVWMASATDGWIVGAGGTMLRWNGTAWHAVASGTTAALYDVHGSSPSAVWVVGEGVTRKWNGSAVVSGATDAVTLTRVYAAPNGSVVAVDGNRGYSLDGAAWRADIGGNTTFTSTSVGGLAGVGNTVWAVGQLEDWLGPDSEVAYQWNGTGWVQADTREDAELFDAFADGGEVYGVRANDIIAMSTLEPVIGGPNGDVAMTRAFGAGGDVFLPSTGTLPWHRKAGTWTHDASFGWDIGFHAIAAVGDAPWFGGTAAVPDPRDLTSTRGLGVVRWNQGLVPLDTAQSAGDETDAIGGTSSADAWVVTESASPSSYGVVAWHVENGVVGSGSSPLAHVNAMHVAGAEVLLFADDGIEAIDDTVGSRGWKPVPVAGAASGEHWRAVAELPGGDLAIVGNTAAPAAPHVAMRTAGAWAEIAAPAIAQLCAVTATSATDVWAAGFDGTGASEVGKVAHWNGAAWTVTALPGAQELCAIAIDGTGAVWASGAGSPLFERAGNGTWTASQPLFVGSVGALRMVGGDLWLAGDHGAILRRQL